MALRYRGLSGEQQGQVTGLDNLNPRINKLAKRVQSGNARNPNKARKRLQGLRGERNEIVGQQFQRGEDNSITPINQDEVSVGKPNLGDPVRRPAGPGMTDNSFMGMRDILFPGQRNFEQKDFEGSSIYKFQRDEALSDVDKYAASRGLTKSGAEFAMRDKALSGVTAREADRASNVAQRDADRYYGMVRDEAGFRERGSNEAFDRSYQLMDLAARQNPLDSIYGGAENYADYVNKIGKNKGQFASNNYNRPTMGVGSPGGGASLPPFIAPYPSAPNFNNIDNIANTYDGQFGQDMFSQFSGYFR